MGSLGCDRKRNFVELKRVHERIWPKSRRVFRYLLRRVHGLRNFAKVLGGAAAPNSRGILQGQSILFRATEKFCDVVVRCEPRVQLGN